MSKKTWDRKVNQQEKQKRLQKRSGIRKDLKNSRVNPLLVIQPKELKWTSQRYLHSHVYYSPLPRQGRNISVHQQQLDVKENVASILNRILIIF